MVGLLNFYEQYKNIIVGGNIVRVCNSRSFVPLPTNASNVDRIGLVGSLKMGVVPTEATSTLLSGTGNADDNLLIVTPCAGIIQLEGVTANGADSFAPLTGNSSTIIIRKATELQVSELMRTSSTRAAFFGSLGGLSEVTESDFVLRGNRNLIGIAILIRAGAATTRLKSINIELITGLI